MPNFSRIIQIGHLARDPEIKYLDGGKAVCNTSIATNFGPKDKQEVCFIDVTFWDKTAENVAKFLHKGDAILVEGRLKQDNWEDKTTGAKRSKHLIIASSMTMLGKKSDTQDEQHPQNPSTTTVNVNAGAIDNMDSWADTTGTDPEQPEKTPF